MLAERKKNAFFEEAQKQKAEEEGEEEREDERRGEKGRRRQGSEGRKQKGEKERKHSTQWEVVCQTFEFIKLLISSLNYMIKG